MWLPKRFVLPRNILTQAFSFLLSKKSPRCWIMWPPTTPGKAQLSERGLCCNKYKYKSLFGFRKHAMDFFSLPMQRTTSTKICFVFFHFQSSVLFSLFYFIYWESKVHVDRKPGEKKMENMEWENFKNYAWNESYFWSSILIFVGFFPLEYQNIWGQ